MEASCEAALASLSVGETMLLLQTCQLSLLTASEVDSIKAMVAAVAVRGDEQLRAQLAALVPAAAAAAVPGGGDEVQSASFDAFLAEAGLERFGDGLRRAGVASVDALLALAPDALKGLRDPETGAKVLAVGPLSKLRNPTGALVAETKATLAS